MTTSIVGHDDLSPWNTTVEENEQGKWRLRGIYDFGNTKLSNPERELRFLPLLSPAATDSAVQSYTAATNKPISRDLISFWSRSQVTAMRVNQLERGDQPGFYAAETMKMVYPGYDWRTEFAHALLEND